MWKCRIWRRGLCAMCNGCPDKLPLLSKPALLECRKPDIVGAEWFRGWTLGQRLTQKLMFLCLPWESSHLLHTLIHDCIVTHFGYDFWSFLNCYCFPYILSVHTQYILLRQVHHLVHNSEISHESFSSYTQYSSSLAIQLAGLHHRIQYLSV